MAECKKCGTTWLDVSQPGPCPLCELNSLLAKLPKTADGVSVVPGMTVFRPWKGGGLIPHEVPQLGCYGNHYSTRQLAEAAEKGKDDG